METMSAMDIQKAKVRQERVFCAVIVGQGRTEVGRNTRRQKQSNAGIRSKERERKIIECTGFIGAGFARNTEV